MLFGYGWPRVLGAGFASDAPVCLCQDQSFSIVVRSRAIEVFTAGQHRVRVATARLLEEEDDDDVKQIAACWHSGKSLLAVLVGGRQHAQAHTPAAHGGRCCRPRESAPSNSLLPQPLPVTHTTGNTAQHVTAAPHHAVRALSALQQGFASGARKAARSCSNRPRHLSPPPPRPCGTCRPHPCRPPTTRC
jgi:hypothetical protein